MISTRAKGGYEVGEERTMSSGERIPNWISFTVRMGASEWAREVAMMRGCGFGVDVGATTAVRDLVRYCRLV